MFLILVIALAMPMFVHFIAEKRVSGFPRLVLALLSAVPAVLVFQSNLIDLLSDAQFFGLLLLSVISGFTVIVNLVKAFIPSSKRVL